MHNGLFGVIDVGQQDSYMSQTSCCGCSRLGHDIAGHAASCRRILVDLVVGEKLRSNLSHQQLIRDADGGAICCVLGGERFEAAPPFEAHVVWSFLLMGQVVFDYGGPDGELFDAGMDERRVRSPARLRKDMPTLVVLLDNLRVERSCFDWRFDHVGQ